jgi:glycosyltransferase involved in cell wall biosynthesis
LKDKVSLLVRNVCNNDPRVLKEAESLSKHYAVSVLALGSSGFKEEEQKKGFKIFRFGRNSALGRLFFSFGVISHLIKTKPKVIHANDLDTLLEAKIAGLFSSSKVVFDSHELFNETLLISPLSCLSRFYWIILEHALIRSTDLVITVSEPIASRLQEKYSLSKKPTVIYNVRNPEFTNSKVVSKINNLKSKASVVLYAGNYTESRKPSFYLMFSALSIIPKKERPFFVVLGFQPNEEMKKKIEDLSVVSNVVFFDKQKLPAMFSSIRAADAAFVALSNNCRNNFLAAPNKLFDYLSCNTPVISPNYPALRKIVDETVCGELFEDDPASLSECIKKAVKGDYSQGLKHAREKYNWNNESKKLFSAYSSLLPCS